MSKFRRVGKELTKWQPCRDPFIHPCCNCCMPRKTGWASPPLSFPSSLSATARPTPPFLLQPGQPIQPYQCTAPSGIRAASAGPSYRKSSLPSPPSSPSPPGSFPSRLLIHEREEKRTKEEGRIKRTGKKKARKVSHKCSKDGPKRAREIRGDSGVGKGGGGTRIKGRWRGGARGAATVVKGLVYWAWSGSEGQVYLEMLQFASCPRDVDEGIPSFPFHLVLLIDVIDLDGLALNFNDPKHGLHFVHLCHEMKYHFSAVIGNVFFTATSLSISLLPPIFNFVVVEISSFF